VLLALVIAGPLKVLESVALSRRFVTAGGVAAGLITGASGMAVGILASLCAVRLGRHMSALHGQAPAKQQVSPWPAVPECCTRTSRFQAS